MRNAGLEEAQAGTKIAGRNINNLRYADDTTLMAESEEESKSLLMRVKEESEKAGLKQHSKNKDHGIWSHQFMANRWRKSENSDRFSFLGSKITADGDCSHEIKRHLLLGRKAMINLDSILKSRDITLPKKIQQSLTTLCQQSRVKAMVFPLAVYGSESWTIKK